MLQHVLERAFERIVHNEEKSKSVYYGAIFEDLVNANLVRRGYFDSKKYHQSELRRGSEVYISRHMHTWDLLCRLPWPSF